MKNTKPLFLLFLGIIFLLLAITIVTAELELPEGVQRLQQHHLEQARSFSILLAFIGGVLSILSPCFLPLFPSYVAYMFKEKKDITKMTLFFFAGLSTVFILMGLGATALGSILEASRIKLIEVSGVFLIIFGIVIAIGKGLTVPFLRLHFKKAPKHDTLGVTLFGAAFAIGFTPCIGAILFTILFIAATFHNYAYSVILLFTYSLGLIIPYLILSIVYDTHKWHEKSWIRGKSWHWKTFTFNTTQLISGMVIIITGILFLLYKGTYIINDVDPLGTMKLFYYLNDKLIELGIPSVFGDVLGLLVIVLLLTITYIFIKKRSQ